MDAARQVIRWSIPGAIGIVAFVFFRLLHGLWEEPGAQIVPPETLDSAAAVTFLIGATVPIGFLIYQIYFLIHEFQVPGLNLVPGDRGAELFGRVSGPDMERVMSRLNLESAPNVDRFTERWFVFLRLVEERRGPEGRRQYRERRSRNLALLRAWLDLEASSGRAVELKNNYTTMSDIFHAQGAGRVGIRLAGLADACLSLAVWGTRGHMPSGLAILLVVVLAVGLGRMLNYVRDNTWRDAQATLAAGLIPLLRNESE